MRLDLLSGKGPMALGKGGQYFGEGDVVSWVCHGAEQVADSLCSMYAYVMQPTAVIKGARSGKTDLRS